LEIGTGGWHWFYSEKPTAVLRCKGREFIVKTIDFGIIKTDRAFAYNIFCTRLCGQLFIFIKNNKNSLYTIAM
jgi:hypothetical protein